MLHSSCMMSVSTALEPLLSVRGLTVRFQNALLPAVDNISFAVAPGESLGLVGESGSGKSVTALSILRLLPESSTTIQGSVLFKVRNDSPRDLLTLSGKSMQDVRGREIAMIFQEPMTSLNPVMPVGAQIAEAYLAHKRAGETRPSARAVREAVHQAMEEVALPNPVQRARDYPHQLSGGQRQRILIAMAIINRPLLLIADEPTTALDVTVQQQILELLSQLREHHGLSMLFISHDLAVVSQVAERVLVMHRGVVVESAPVQTLFHNPGHSYTRALLQAVPTLHMPLDTPLGSPAEADWQGGVLQEQTPGHWVRSL